MRAELIYAAHDADKAQTIGRFLILRGCPVTLRPLAVPAEGLEGEAGGAGGAAGGGLIELATEEEGLTFQRIWGKTFRAPGADKTVLNLGLEDFQALPVSLEIVLLSPFLEASREARAAMTQRAGGPAVVGINIARPSGWEEKQWMPALGGWLHAKMLPHCSVLLPKGHWVQRSHEGEADLSQVCGVLPRVIACPFFSALPLGSFPFSVTLASLKPPPTIKSLRPEIRSPPFPLLSSPPSTSLSPSSF